MDDDTLLLDQANRQRLCGHQGRNPQNCVPATLNSKTRDGGDGGKLPIQCRQILLNAGENLLLDRVASGKQPGQSMLDGSVDREERVGDDFEAAGGFGEEGIRAEGGDPCGFHLGQAGDLAQSAEDIGEDGMLAGGKAGRARCRGVGGVEGIIQEDFIDDEGEVVLLTDAFERQPFGAGSEMAGRVVGMDNDYGAGARGKASGEGGEIEMPAVIVEQGIGDEAHIVEVSKKLKQGIAGLGDEDLRAGIAMEAEEVAVGFAGAGGEKNLRRRNLRRGGVGIVLGDGGASYGEAARVGLVLKGFRTAEGAQDSGIVILETAGGWIRCCEIKVRLGGAAQGIEGSGVRGLLKVPAGAAGKWLCH